MLGRTLWLALRVFVASEGLEVARTYTVGDCVVYTRDKIGTSPGPRAKNVSPSMHGETYSYEVEKYWRVTKIVSPNEIELVTRRGKKHTISLEDPRLRKASWWEKLFHADRFPPTDLGSADTQTTA